MTAPFTGSTLSNAQPLPITKLPLAVPCEQTSIVNDPSGKTWCGAAGATECVEQAVFSRTDGQWPSAATITGKCVDVIDPITKEWAGSYFQLTGGDCNFDPQHGDPQMIIGPNIDTGRSNGDSYSDITTFSCLYGEQASCMPAELEDGFPCEGGTAPASSCCSRGQCNAGVCRCYDGYSGNHCEFPPPQPPVWKCVGDADDWPPKCVPVASGEQGVSRATCEVQLLGNGGLCTAGDCQKFFQRKVEQCRPTQPYPANPVCPSPPEPDAWGNCTEGGVCKQVVSDENIQQPIPVPPGSPPQFQYIPEREYDCVKA